MSVRRPFLLVLAVGLAGACGSPARDEPTAPRAERPPPELGPRESALLEAYDRGGEAWEQARAEALLDPQLERFLVDQLVLRMVRAYDGITQPGGERKRKDFERAEAELVRLGEAAAPILGGLLAVSDGVVALLSARTLERIGRPAVEAVLPLARAPSPLTRRRAVEVLERLPHAAEAEEQVRAVLAPLLLEDPEWIVRAQTARTVAVRGARDREVKPSRLLLERALLDPDPAVAEAAARGLALLADPLAVPALLQRLAVAVEAGDLRQVRACQSALSAVTGGARERDLEGWRRWWFEHRDELQRQASPR